MLCGKLEGPPIAVQFGQTWVDFGFSKNGAARRAAEVGACCDVACLQNPAVEVLRNHRRLPVCPCLSQ
jgi:hypothetical protein